MARIFARRKPAPTLTAAVAPVADPMQSFRASLSTAADWQSQGWDMYRQVGELRFLCSWLAAALSRCRLIASEIDPTTGTPTGTTGNEQVAQVVRDIAGGPAGQARMLSRWATMYTVPGEVFIAALSRTIARLDVEEWHMLSRAEIKKTGSGLTLTLEDGSKHEFVPGRDVLFRVWTPDPQNSQDADSPVRSALEPLTEIVESSATVRNAMRSRLIGGKMLFVPSQMSLPKTSPAPTADHVDPDAPNLPVPPVMEQAKPQDLQDMLFDVATAATDDPDSAAAHLPIIIGADGEQIGNVKLVEIGQDVSEQALKTREAAIRRFALASDMPPEILLGIASANHWGGGVIQEEAHRHAIRPLEELCDALTVSLLRPKLEQLGLDPDAYVVWYDASALVQDPDKKQEALDAHDRGAITSAALRRHLGFADEDGYDLNTLAGWQQAAADKAAANPELLPLLAPLISAALPQITPPAGENVEVVEGVRAP